MARPRSDEKKDDGLKPEDDEKHGLKHRVDALEEKVNAIVTGLGGAIGMNVLPAPAQPEPGSREAILAQIAKLEELLKGLPAPGEEVAATPAAEEAAAEAGVDVAELAPGSGAEGKVTKADVEKASA